MTESRARERSALALAAAGAVAAILMIAAELTPIAKVDVASGSCEVIGDANPQLADRCSVSGLERHGGALLLLGALSLAMSYGAGIGRSHAASAALLAIGTVVLALALVSDLPETTRTGAIGRNFEGAKAEKGVGFWLELVAGGLATWTGAVAWARPRRHRDPVP
jgi:hypothetical protein